MTGEHGETGSQMNRGPWAGGQGGTLPHDKQNLNEIKIGDS